MIKGGFYKTFSDKWKWTETLSRKSSEISTKQRIFSHQIDILVAHSTDGVYRFTKRFSIELFQSTERQIKMRIGILFRPFIQCLQASQTTFVIIFLQHWVYQMNAIWIPWKHQMCLRYYSFAFNISRFDKNLQKLISSWHCEHFPVGVSDSLLDGDYVSIHGGSRLWRHHQQVEVIIT